MKIIPEIDLEDDLEIPYKPELHSWIVDNLLGLRKIKIQLFKRRDSYDSIGEIEFFAKGEKNLPTEKPRHDGKELKSDELCEIIMKIIQFDCESRDTEGKYRIQCLRNMGSIGEKTIAKHIDVPIRGSDDEAGFSAPNDREELEVVPMLMKFIDSQNNKLMDAYGLITSLVAPLQTQNTNLHKQLQDIHNINVKVKELEFQKELIIHDAELENKLKIENAKYSKQKWDNFYKYIEKANVAPMLMGALAAKLNIDPKALSMGQQVAQQPNQEESIEVQKAKFEEQLKIAPLQTMANFLYNSLDETQKEEILEHLEENLYKDLETFLNSTSEKEARNNFKELGEKIANIDNPMRLAKVMDILNEQQKNVLTQILNFKV